MEEEIDTIDSPETSAAENIPPQEFVAFVTQSKNLAADMDDGQLNEIAQQAIADHAMDKDSMSDWFERMERGLKLAQLVKEDKDYPFKGSANVKYPLITSAALQFNARAYPAIVPPDRVVKAKVWGADRGGKKAERAERISEHMSWQLAAQISEWETETDKMLTLLPIVGTMVRKWWYDPIAKRPRCRVIDPGKFIVNDSVTCLDDAPRATEELPLYPTEIETRRRTGQFREDFEYETQAEDEQAPEQFIEQHTLLDLDEDGYFEPYIVTVHLDTQKVVRIVADFSEDDVSYEMEEQVVVAEVPAMDAYGQQIMVQQPQRIEVPTGILSIKRGTYFVAHQFLPGLKGGFHGTGLGLLLGDISDSINTIINMLLDAGHYASLGGGFIGSDFRMKGGAQRHRPGEWKMTQATGSDIKSSIVPLTFPGPDATLFQMLGLLIDAGREIASVKDVVTGEQPRQQQTATTTLALIEQGMMVFTAAYKRIWRACKAEYQLLAKINRDTVSVEEYARFHDGENQFDPAQDYAESDMDVQPVADPSGVTKMQKAAKAQFVMQLAEMGLVDRQEALLRIAEAMDVEDVESLIPQPDPMQQQMQMLQMEDAMSALMERRAKIELTLAQVEETKAKTVEALNGAQNDTARVAIEARSQRLDEVTRMLEDERGRLDLAVKRAVGMARSSGNGTSQGFNGQTGGGAQTGAFGGMATGATGFGGGQGFAFDAGGMGGGLL